MSIRIAARGTAAAAALWAAALIASGIPTARAAGAALPVLVTISDKGCEPASVSVAPGTTVFKITNGSKRAVEWEILKGSDIIAERENILPGFTETLSATLAAGQYQITCGLRSNPRGVLTVGQHS